MLYYVKSEILFKNISVEIKEETNAKKHYFYFDVGNLKQKQNNEKKKIIFEYKETREWIKNKKKEKKMIYKIDYCKLVVENGCWNNKYSNLTPMLGKGEKY